MGKTKFRSLLVLLALAGIFACPSISIAQWSLSRTFQSAVRSVYFLDQQGSETTGFVGLDNTSIWRTTDNGASWTQSTTPSYSYLMSVTDFAFRNTSQGWCSVRNSSNSKGAIWETTDGGQTWVEEYSGNNMGGAVSIAYSSASGLLVAPCWYSSSIMSTDFGVTWTNFAPSYQNGATFSGNLGFVGLFTLTLTTLYSTNGGVSWNNAIGLDQETWAPWGLPGTSIFAASAEKTHQIFISANGGANWSNPYTFAPTIVPTGCIRGNEQYLFVQTATNGMYCSTDVGNTWLSICGPSHALDTRFYAIGKQVFAADGADNLWYISDALTGSSASLSLDKTILSYSGVRCGSYDSILHFSSISACQSGMLDSATLIGSSNFSVSTGSLPRLVNSSDSIQVQYNPGPASVLDSAKLKLVFNLGTRIVDTIISLYGTAKSSSSYSHNPSLDLSTVFACVGADSEVFIHNYSCDSLQITNLTISDTSHFHLRPKAGIKTIAPAQIDTIPIDAFSNSAGRFTSELKMQLVAGGTIHINDSLPLTFTIQQTGQAALGSLRLTVLDGCEPIDTSVSMLVTPCDSVRITLASLSDTSEFKFSSPFVPITIPAGGSFPFPLHIEPGSAGTDSTKLHVQYQSGSTFTDTIITLSVKVLYDIPARLTMADTFISMGTVSAPCASSSKWLTFGNKSCKLLTVDSIVWENSGTAFSVGTKSFPFTLAKDTGIDSIEVNFQPDAADSTSNRLHIAFHVNGVQLDTAITISGIGISSFHDSILTQSLQYDTILSCQNKTLVGEIKNLSCDTVLATSGTIAGTDYTIQSPSFPIRISPDSTLEIQIELQSGGSGSLMDSATIIIHDSVDGQDHPGTIMLLGYAQPVVHSLRLTNSSFSFPNIVPCTVQDSSFVLTNTGTCDAIVITDTLLTGSPGISISFPFALPFTLPPDSSVQISFRIAPDEDTLQNAMLSLSGTYLDTNIQFSFAALPGGKALQCSIPDSVFVTKPCIPISKTFWIANTGCEPIPIDSILLHGDAEFSMGNIPPPPAILPAGDTLFYSVRYDPGSSGSSNAQLTLLSNDVHYSRTVSLVGTVNGTVPSARVAFQMQGAASALPSHTVSAALIVLDDIGDSTQLQTVSFTLATNWNVLGFANIVTASGWSVADTTWNSNGSLLIRLFNTNPGNVPANTTLATCYFKAYVSDSSECDIQMSGLLFNDSDASYANCTLTPLSVPGSIHFTELDTCGTPILRGSMDGNLALRIISVQPNPASRNGDWTHLDLTLHSAESGTATITLTDMLGREAWRTSVACGSGTQVISLDMPHSAEGAAFLNVSNGTMHDARNILIEGSN